jgi:hypothetical protein
MNKLTQKTAISIQTRRKNKRKSIHHHRRFVVLAATVIGAGCRLDLLHHDVRVEIVDRRRLRTNLRRIVQRRLTSKSTKTVNL